MRRGIQSLCPHSWRKESEKRAEAELHLSECLKVIMVAFLSDQIQFYARLRSLEHTSGSLILSRVVQGRVNRSISDTHALFAQVKQGSVRMWHNAEMPEGFRSCIGLLFGLLLRRSALKERSRMRDEDRILRLQCGADRTGYCLILGWVREKN